MKIENPVCCEQGGTCAREARGAWAGVAGWTAFDFASHELDRKRALEVAGHNEVSKQVMLNLVGNHV